MDGLVENKDIVNKFALITISVLCHRETHSIIVCKRLLLNHCIMVENGAIEVKCLNPGKLSGISTITSDNMTKESHFPYTRTCSSTPHNTNRKHTSTVQG